MIPNTISPGATTAAVRLIVFGNAAPIIPPPAATITRKNVPSSSEKRRRPLLIRILEVRNRLDDVLCNSAEVHPATPASPLATWSGTNRHLQSTIPAALGTNPGLSGEADHRPTCREAKRLPNDNASSRSSEQVTDPATFWLVGDDHDVATGAPSAAGSAATVARSSSNAGGSVERHAVCGQAPGRVDRDHADQASVALAARTPRRDRSGVDSSSSRRSARPGRPIDWIFTSYWSDQKYGGASIGLALVGRRQHVAAGELPLLGGDGPVLDSDVFAVGQWMRPRDDVAGAEDVRVGGCGQRRVAREPGIRVAARCRPATPCSGPRRGRRPRRRRRCARRRRARPPRRGHRRGVRRPRSRGAGRRRGRGAARRTTRPSCGPSGSIGVAAMSISVTSRPALRAVWATSQPMKPAPTIATRGRRSNAARSASESSSVRST